MWSKMATFCSSSSTSNRFPAGFLRLVKETGWIHIQPVWISHLLQWAHARVRGDKSIVGLSDIDFDSVEEDCRFYAVVGLDLNLFAQFDHGKGGHFRH